MTNISFLSIILALMFYTVIEANQYDAEAELLKLYGPDTGTVVSAEWRNEFTSISRFVSAAANTKEQPLLIAYMTDEGEEAARILHSFFYRRRAAGLGNKLASAERVRVYLVKGDVIKLNPHLLKEYKTVLIGKVADYQFFKRMASRGKLKAVKNRAQFHLFANPNALTVVSESPKMFPELARAFVKSWSDFDDDVYSYFYLE